MTADFDLLPASYHQRIASRAANRELRWLCLPVLLALLTTDGLLRARVRGVEQMVHQARENADRGQHLAAETRALTRRIEELQAGLGIAADRLAAPRMIALLDGLVAERPPGVRFQDLLCSHDPWAPQQPPAIQLRASCTVAGDFTRYLTALRAAPELPPLTCQRSDIRPGSSDFGFLLETDSTALEPRDAAGGGR